MHLWLSPALYFPYQADTERYHVYAEQGRFPKVPLYTAFSTSTAFIVHNSNNIPPSPPAYMEGCHGESQDEEVKVGISKDSFHLINVLLCETWQQQHKSFHNNQSLISEKKVWIQVKCVLANPSPALNILRFPNQVQIQGPFPGNVWGINSDRMD